MAYKPDYLPPLPEIGYPETYYAHQAKQAEAMGAIHAREAAKVGQYITLGLDPKQRWEAKRRFFRHALRRHCVPPAVSDDLLAMYYQRLADLVRRFAGQEALRIASERDDEYAVRVRGGEPVDLIRLEARIFFDDLMGDLGHCPSHFNEEDWAQLKLLRSAWVPEEEVMGESVTT